MGVERAVMRSVRSAVAGAVTVVVLAGACSGSKRDVAAPPTSTTTTAATTPITAPPTTTTTARPAPSGPHKLTAFASCGSLLRHLKREAVRTVTPWGLPRTQLFGTVGAGRTVAVSASTASAAAEAAPSSGGAGGPSFSGTNIQEAGVDEPDLVKTDGRLLVTVANHALKIVDVSKPAPAVVGTFALPQEDAAPELLLSGSRVLLFSHVHGAGRPASRVRIVDIADPAKPVEAAAMTLDGSYVSARLAAGVVRLVMLHDPKGPELVMPHGRYDSQPSQPNQPDQAALVESHRRVIRQSKIQDWLPFYEVTRPGSAPVRAPLVPCSAMLRPRDFAGLTAVSVPTVDPADPKPSSVACVLGGGRIVYASPQNLYVATERWEDRSADTVASSGSGGVVVRAPLQSQVHQFAIPGRDPAVYVGSGQVTGSLLNQFSMSEHEGHLRVATTTMTPDGRTTDNVVSTLRADGGRLVEVGRLAGLGHEGETIHSVRFIGRRGYVVTFRQTDPLYVLDLSDPRRPKALGELQVPGFSSYLHPLSDNALLGVGQGPDDRGGQGLQVSLFDVRDPTRPVRLANQVFVGHSLAQHDHHAFLWWAPAGKLVLPYESFGYDADAPRHAALVLPVDPAKGFGKPTMLDHADTVLRALVSDGRLLTVSADGVAAYDVTTLAERSRTPW